VKAVCGKARRFHQRSSELGKGSIFTWYLPYHSETNTNNMQAEKLKILLVEDETQLGTLLREYLEAKGYSTVLAVNGKQGLTCSQRINSTSASWMMMA